MQSRISIVTPSYNHARFIERTVKSVIGQRYPNLEYIVMDGGSMDGTQKLLAPYRSQLADLVSAKDGGQSDAIGRGFEKTTGDIMAWINSDDMLAPGTLDYVNRYFASHPNVDAIYSHRLAVDADDRAIWYWLLPRHSDYHMSRWDFIPQETCFWRRSLWERAGNLDRSFQFAMDYDLFVRYMRAGRFRRVNRFLAAFRQHADAKTTQVFDTIGRQEIQRIWDANGFRRRFFHKVLAHRHWRGLIWRGDRFARQRKVLPGNLPGLGYSYDRVWGGLLHAS